MTRVFRSQAYDAVRKKMATCVAKFLQIISKNTLINLNNHV